MLFFKEILEDIKLDCKKYWKVNENFMRGKILKKENDVAGMGNAYILF